MIVLPDFNKSFEYENNFYLSCQNSRISKIIAHYELFKKIKNLNGDIIECGVFKGSSLLRFAAFREIFQMKNKIIGFDAFGKFPKTKFKEDQTLRKKFITDAGNEGISKEQLMKVLQRKKISNVKLVKGDVTETIPKFLKLNPKLRISMLNLDTDSYEPAVAILENLFPKIVKGGILILDDYKIWPGETKAVDDYFKNKRIKIQRFQYSKTPHYIIKTN
ncbi:TylF/MycF/NovP-related O-methyltransferase [Nitrosarchaeum sp.]|uniref:TylF/MycF/NovP-related O-methyltransferase n=1 Tax=Nitrosarchaeum sp. TaxID=2026886 RepID=UPI00247E7222|nr:TylF/MycF/NovP-related O-methyltransferase [Nitrosarchaeum sp.]MCV0411926.1 TylF/MycF family methyltransferase [Nitrosarchaeum sp.]